MLKVNKAKITNMARILSDLHRIQVENLRNLQLPTYHFIDYFFPGAIEHPDLHQALMSLIETTPLRQQHIIHGDFHIRNMLEQNDRYTVIDWTNGQLGEPGYDFAWSLLLQKIYVTERHAALFRSAYLSDHNLPQQHLEGWEALACLRWLLLFRREGVPADRGILARARRVISDNPRLTGFRLEL